jgi:hypothetical protein
MVAGPDARDLISDDTEAWAPARSLNLPQDPLFFGGGPDVCPPVLGLLPEGEVPLHG